MTTTEQRQADASAYLERELGPRAPQSLGLVESFEEQPLEEEGAVSIFAFDLRPAPAGCATATDPRHYVVTGETSPNYFPAYGLSVDDAYSLHVGTRFMLGMDIALIDAALEPPTARDGVRQFAGLCNPDAPIDDLVLAALFRCEDQVYATYAVSLGGRRVYCFGADCPPGFSELSQHPPQVALRLHLGRLIRREAREDVGSAAGGQRGA